jgi:pimeloyl-ACP methyl ester carboxylesterase
LQENFITYKTKNIFYRKYGSGKPVMLVHGFGEDGTIWNNQIAALQNHYLLLVPDLPGSGKSEMLTENNIAITDYAEVLYTILAEEKITQCSMLGHSMGGYIALAFAEKYPNLLNSLGLVHSSSYADTELKIATRKKAIEFIQANGSQAFLKTSTPNLFWDKEKNKEAIDILIAEGENISQAALVQYYNAMITRKDTTEVLKTFSKPILFIIGQYDQAVPFADSMQQTYAPSYAYIHILRKSAHMGMLEEKDKTNKIISSFCKAFSLILSTFRQARC